MFVSALQKYEPKDWTGLTTENHLGTIFAQEPILVSNMIENIYKVNLGDDLISFSTNGGYRAHMRKIFR